jgi:hypothetical protein
MITVACVWVAGNVPYSVEYVTKLRSMVARHLDCDFRFAVLTDRPSLAAEALHQERNAPPADIVVIPPPAPLAGWWAKLELFNENHWPRFAERVLYLDLDVLVCGQLGPIVDYCFFDHLSLVPPGGNFRPRGYRTVQRYNSSVMVFDLVPRLALLHSEFKLRYAMPGAKPAPLWGDQDWIGEREPDLRTMPAEWFPRLSDLGFLHVHTVADFPDAKVILCKKPKPHKAVELYPVVAELWQ